MPLNLQPEMKQKKTYQACFDVKYHNHYAIIGFVLFDNHQSKNVVKAGTVRYENPAEYEPGKFYKRELPCLLEAIKEIKEKVELIYIDAHVWLGDNKKGLGAWLYEALNKEIAVVGIAKSFFVGAGEQSVAVLRGESNKALYVSSVGIKINEAAKMVEEMYGAYRLPEMIKLADTISRSEDHKTMCFGNSELVGLGFSPIQDDYTYKDRCMK